MTLSGPPSSWPQDARDEWNERAAIMEFDGGLTRERAEQEAELIVRASCEEVEA